MRRNQQAIADLTERYPPPHRFAVVDVASHQAVQAWADDLLVHGTPDLLLNNAALMNEPAPLWEVPPDDFATLIDVNVKGVVWVLRAFLPAMIRQGRGVIVNLSSGWGRSAAPKVGPYVASKWAIEGLTGSLAMELPAGLAAVSVNPGIIHTEMLARSIHQSA